MRRATTWHAVGESPADAEAVLVLTVGVALGIDVAPQRAEPQEVREALLEPGNVVGRLSRVVEAQAARGAELRVVAEKRALGPHGGLGRRAEEGGLDLEVVLEPLGVARHQVVEEAVAPREHRRPLLGEGV
jgi:hypothetical protein